MKIAVIGSGIAGMSAAHTLAAQQHEVHLYEASARLGGHTATLDVNDNGKQLAVDTGFIVYNDHTYPLFIELMDSLKVANRPTDMSFSVSDALSGLEYAGSDLNSLFLNVRHLISQRD